MQNRTAYNSHMHAQTSTMQNYKHTNKNHIIYANHKNNNNTATKTKTLPPPPRSHGSTTQACAACKYQRRKCASDCILAPYFPHDCHRQFLNAHHLFGVSNIIKIVRHLDPQAKDHAMRTIIYQSDARAADPVGGCYRIIRDLENRISLAKAELELVLQHLALCRAAAQQQVAQPHPPCEVAVDDVNSWGCVPGNVHGHAESISSSFPHHENRDHHERKLSLEEECNHEDMMRPILEHLACDGDDDFKFDCHGNIVSSKDAFLIDDHGVFKEEDECFSFVQDHGDLKAAATFFSLTNCDI